MKIKQESQIKSIRLFGENSDLIVYHNNKNGIDEWIFSLCYKGFEYGCIDSVTVTNDIAYKSSKSIKTIIK